MRITYPLFYLLMIMFLIVGPVHQGMAQLEEREWHGVDGSRIAMGEFVRLERQKVVIHNSDGIISIPFGEISWKDKDFIREAVRTKDVEEGHQHKKQSVIMTLILLGLLTGLIASLISYIIGRARGGQDDVANALVEFE
ncbi:MAG: hypothetical protein AAGC88_15950 [Bacteroidota bacterium]